MMRAESVRRAGGYRNAFLRCEDYDLWLRMATPDNMANLDAPLLRYRLHENQVTWDGFEQRILSYLIHHKNRIVSRTELAEHLYDANADRDFKSIEVVIGRLRKKTGEGVIETRRGEGYVLRDAPAGAS